MASNREIVLNSNLFVYVMCKDPRTRIYLILDLIFEYYNKRSYSQTGVQSCPS